MGAPYSGRNSLIYVSGIEIVGLNTWSINVNTSAVATPQCGDTFTKKVAGQKEWSISINSWDQGDANPLFDAAEYDGSCTLLIYPTRNTLTRYWSGSAIFSMSGGGGTNAGVSENASAEGSTDLTATGWTA